jgi:hypothetical protein
MLDHLPMWPAIIHVGAGMTALPGGSIIII